VFQEFARELYQRDRIILTSNPSLVRLHECVDVLLYHGASIDSMIDALPHLKDGYNSPHIVMEELVRKRHLNPIYGHKTRVFPEREDHLVIEPVPNVFHAGHVHTLGLGSYRDLLLVNSGAFQGRTEFQVRLGHHPTPSVIPVLNLRTGEPHRISFAGGKGGSA
jgi:DNA polymerase II small subunit